MNERENQPTAPSDSYELNPPPAYIDGGSKNNENFRVDIPNNGHNVEPAPVYIHLAPLDTKNAFIRKVYSVLAIQLLVTFIPVLICSIYKEQIPYAIRTNPVMYWTAWGVTIVLMFMFICCPKLLRKTPLNYGLLAVFTIAESYFLSVISMYYDTSSVAIALAATIGVVVVVTIIVVFTSFDFTKLWPIAIALVFAWLFVCIGFIWYKSDAMVIVYAGLGVTIFTIFLAIDTYLILKGGRVQYNEEDYIFATLNLYLDIINIFMYILMLLGGSE